MINEKTVKAYCKDYTKIENYDKAVTDTTQTWEVHHRFENLGFTHKQLKNMKMYYDVEPRELIFLTKAEHRTLHHKGKKNSEETKAKISAAKKGNKNMLGKKHSEETKSKLSAAKKDNAKACTGN